MYADHSRSIYLPCYYTAGYSYFSHLVQAIHIKCSKMIGVPYGAPTLDGEMIGMSIYLLTAGNTGYEVEMTRHQAEHMLSLWGVQYNIDDVVVGNPIHSPSGYSRLELVYTSEVALSKGVS